MEQGRTSPTQNQKPSPTPIRPCLMNTSEAATINWFGEYPTMFLQAYARSTHFLRPNINPFSCTPTATASTFHMETNALVCFGAQGGWSNGKRKCVSASTFAHAEQSHRSAPAAHKRRKLKQLVVSGLSKKELTISTSECGLQTAITETPKHAWKPHTQHRTWVVICTRPGVAAPSVDSMLLPLAWVQLHALQRLPRSKGGQI